MLPAIMQFVAIIYSYISNKRIYEFELNNTVKYSTAYLILNLLMHRLSLV